MKLPFLPGLVLPLLVVLTPVARGQEEPVTTEVAVHVAKVTRATLRRSVVAYGSVEPMPATKARPPASAKLSPAVAGIVAEIAGEEGQRVEKDQVLFRLDCRAADAAVAKAEQTVEFATKTVERQRRLIAAEGTSEKLLLESEQTLAEAKTQLAEARVERSLLEGVAPISGTLVRFTARPGEAADAGTVLAEIVDFDRLVAVVAVPSAEAAEVQTGRKVEVRGVTKSDESPLASEVVFVSPQVDFATDTVRAHAAVPKGARLRPGEMVVARIVIEERRDRLAVPRASVYTDHDGQSTLSLVEGGVAKRKVVKVGLRDGDLVEVAGEGVGEGATVVTTGSYALPEETKVRILTEQDK